MDNNHEGWAPGYFVDSIRYSRWPAEKKSAADSREKHLVRPFPTDNAICHCVSPEAAQWISERLNLAAKLEKKARQNAKEAEQTPANTGSPKLLDDMEHFAVLCDRAGNGKDARLVRSWVKQLRAGA